MGRGTDKSELILLFDKLQLEPKKMLEYLKQRGQDYSYSTLKKYYQKYATSKLIVNSIIQK